MLKANNLVGRNPSSADADVEPDDGYLNPEDTIVLIGYIVATTAVFSTLYVSCLYQYNC